MSTSKSMITADEAAPRHKATRSVSAEMPVEELLQLERARDG